MAPKLDATKDMCLKEMGLCSKYDNHSRLNSHEHHRGGAGDVYDHLMNTRIFTLVMNKIFK